MEDRLPSLDFFANLWRPSNWCFLRKYAGTIYGVNSQEKCVAQHRRLKDPAGNRAESGEIAQNLKQAETISRAHWQLKTQVLRFRSGFMACYRVAVASVV